MNENQYNFIQKIIASNSSCPEFVYQNPLLDKNVAKALAKSFMKILNISSQNTTPNNKLRRSILENIRKFCTVEPEGHSKVDDEFTEMVTKLYNMSMGEGPSSASTSVDKQLDAYLVRKLKHLDVNSGFKSTLNPEVIQALMNLNENGVYLDALSRDVIHWNNRLTRHLHLLQSLFANENVAGDFVDDVCIKMKPQIEMLLLTVCSNLLETRDQNIQEILTTNNDLKELVTMCSKSSECFHMCCGILNFLFIMTNFDNEMQKFIPEFVKSVKSICDPETTAALYPYYLSTAVIFLDFDIESLPESLRKQYVEHTIDHLQLYHEKCENELILLLSHYPQWFDIYFSKVN